MNIKALTVAVSLVAIGGYLEPLLAGDDEHDGLSWMEKTKSRVAADKIVFEQFALQTGCKPINLHYLSLVILSGELEKAGLDKFRMRKTVVRELRTAGIYEFAENDYVLDVDVEAIGRSVYYKAEFYKPLKDPHTDLVRSIATGKTWSHYILDGLDKPHLLARGIADLMDKVIKDYLRVNMDSCEN